MVGIIVVLLLPDIIMIISQSAETFINENIIM